MAINGHNHGHRYIIRILILNQDMIYDNLCVYQWLIMVNTYGHGLRHGRGVTLVQFGMVIPCPDKIPCPEWTYGGFLSHGGTLW